MSEHVFCFDWYDKNITDYTDKDWNDFSHWINHGDRERVDYFLSGGIRTTKITAKCIIPKKELTQTE